MHPGETPDIFTIRLQGDLVVVAVSQRVESFDATLIDTAADLLLAPIRPLEEPHVIIDLAEVDYFGSAFLQLLLRCWNLATKTRGGQMVLAGVSEHARNLLHITSLDILWPIYASRQEAIEALLSD